jgi:hypothetical protein
MQALTSFVFILGGTQSISEFKLVLVDPDVRGPSLLLDRRGSHWFAEALKHGELLSSEVVQGRVVSQVFPEL